MSLRYLPIMLCPQMGYQQPRGILAQLHQCIHESQVLLLSCTPSPAWYHAGESSKVLPCVLGEHLTVQGSNTLCSQQQW